MPQAHDVSGLSKKRKNGMNHPVRVTQKGTEERETETQRARDEGAEDKAAEVAIRAW